MLGDIKPISGNCCGYCGLYMTEDCFGCTRKGKFLCCISDIKQCKCMTSDQVENDPDKACCIVQSGEVRCTIRGMCNPIMSQIDQCFCLASTCYFPCDAEKQRPCMCANYCGLTLCYNWGMNAKCCATISELTGSDHLT